MRLPPISDDPTDDGAHIIDHLIGAGGTIITTGSILATLSIAAQAAVDAKMAEWMQAETGTYEPEALRQIHK